MRNRVSAIAILPLSLLGLAACGGANAPSGSNTPTPNAAHLGPGATLALACSGCHSELNGAIASLSAYSETQLQDTLARYKTETDGTTVMHRLARGYSDEDIALVSAYLGHEETAP
ncbi:MAG: hypothetical protein AAGL97_14265 [Pseudomonadota bacterium]